VIRTLTAAATVVAIGCQRETPRFRDAPPTQAVQVLGTITASDSFPISSVIGVGRCGLLLSDARFGRIAETDGDGRGFVVVGTVPGAWRFVHLESVDDDRTLVWSSTRPYVGILDHRRRHLTEVPVATHRWGGPAVGPMVMLANDRYAVLPAADPFKPRPEPDAHAAIPLIEIRGLGGALLDTAGTLVEHGGRYLSWLGARAVVGRQGDTVLVLRLSDATVHRFVTDGAGTTLRPDGFTTLPQYFAPAPSQEHVKRYPWIMVNGELLSATNTPALSVSTIGPDGTLYVVRNAGFTWRTVGSGWLSREGEWRVDSRALEIYTARGQFRGAYVLPVSSPAWMQQDGHGRLLFGTDSGVVVTQDPSAPATRCPTVALTTR
jgi:hypothetical protein